MTANTHDLCGESPLWDHRFPGLRWVDLASQRIHRIALESGRIESSVSSVPVSAIALLHERALIIAGTKGVYAVNQDGHAQLVADRAGEEPLAVNDVAVDPAGRLLIGCTFFDGTPGDYALGKLFSIDLDGTVSVLDEGYHLANGMGFSPDGCQFYATDSITRCIYQYDYDGRSGAVRTKRTLVQATRLEGLPDGLTVDAEGFLWSAQWFGGCVCRYDPNGRLERRVDVPAWQTSSVGFGGPGFSTLFITSAEQPDALAFAPDGYATRTGNVGGQLFQLPADIAGSPEPICRIKYA